MGKGNSEVNDRTENGIDEQRAAAIAIAESGNTGSADSATATAAETGNTGTGTAETGKRVRKSRAVPRVLTPDDSIPTPPAAPEKPRRAKPAKADPTIVAALVAVAGTGMTITGKLLNDEKTWQPVGNELVGVAEPAARIIERFSASETVSKYADYVALGMAVAGIIIPRVLLSMNKSTGVKNDGKKKRSNRAGGESAAPAIPVVKDGKETPEIHPAHDANDGIKSAIYLGD